MEDELGSGRAASVRTSINGDLVRAYMYQDRRLTIPVISMNVQDLNTREMCIKMVTEMFDRLETEPDFRNRAITGDGSWFFFRI